MEKSAEAYRTISEVAQDLDLPQHVLRFWETRFIQIKPLKRGGGRRYYRPEDIDLLRAIRHLLYGEGYTIKGVQKILKEQGARTIAAAYGGAGVLAPAPADRIAQEMPQDFEDDWDDEPTEPAADEAAPPCAVPVSGAGSSVANPAANPAAMMRPQAAALAPSARESLQELLSELADCARILDAARGG